MKKYFDVKLFVVEILITSTLMDVKVALRRSSTSRRLGIKASIMFLQHVHAVIKLMQRHIMIFGFSPVAPQIYIRSIKNLYSKLLCVKADITISQSCSSNEYRRSCDSAVGNHSCVDIQYIAVILINYATVSSGPIPLICLDKRHSKNSDIRYNSTGYKLA